MGQLATDADPLRRSVSPVPKLVIRQGVLAVPVLLDLAVRLWAGRPFSEGELYVAGLVVLAITTVVAVAGSYGPVPRWVVALVPVLDLAGIGLMRLVPEGNGLGLLAVLPAMWLAADHRMRGVGVALLATAGLVSLPSLLYFDPDPSWWSRALLTPTIAVMVAATVAGTAQVWARQNQELEEQGRRLEETLDELVSALKVKDDFVASVSHELRTPLTAIMGFLDLVLTEDQTISTATRHRLVVVRRNSDRLLRLVSDLLFTAQAETGEVTLDRQPTDVAGAVAQALAELSPRAGRDDIRVQHAIPDALLMRVDPVRIRQVVDNLLSNAVKYTPPGGLVTVLLEERADEVELQVSDTGIGIGSEDLDLLFTRFFRTRDAEARAIQGLGLGLAISKAIVEAHGGTIEVDSHVGRGSTFTVRLPHEPLNGGAPSPFSSATNPA